MNIPSDIELIPVSEIIPYINNARTHSEAQVAQIAASIREFGFNNPILVDGDFTIIAGHGRYQAAIKLGMEEVPCIQLAHLTDGQRKAYILADNKLALNAGWDEELLKLELGELGDLTGLVGFSPEEINLLMDGWASDIEKMIKPKGLAVVVQATHECMTWRGVKENDVAMTTSVMRGSFRDEPETRAEFLKLIGI